MNKRGLVGILVIILVIIILFLIAAGAGLIFFDKISTALNSKTVIIGGLVILGLTFHKFIEEVLLTVWGWAKGLVGRIF